MKKTLLTNLTLIIVGAILAVGISYAYAAWGTPTGTFTNPTGTPPANNTDIPLNIGAGDQIKSVGSCSTGNCGGLSLSGAFLAAKSAQFNGQTFLNGTVGTGNGSLAGFSTLRFGGTDTTGTYSTSITTSGGVGTTLAFSSAKLTNVDGTKTLCSNEKGQIVFCNAVDMCSNVSGDQATVPDGYVQNSDGTCSKSPKRFLAIIPYAATDPDINFVGGVVGSKLVLHVNKTPGVTPAPLVAQIGFYNGDKDKGNWVYNDIPGVAPTTFTTGGSRLMNVGETGTYTIKISSQGNLGIKGKDANDANAIGVDFYLKINGNWIRMDNVSSTFPHEEYPIDGKGLSDFAGTFPYTGGSLAGGGSGDTYKYVPYNFSFEKTLPLSIGDQVDVYALVYGWSYRNGTLGIGDGYANFYYSIDANSTVFDITETPN